MAFENAIRASVVVGKTTRVNPGENANTTHQVTNNRYVVLARKRHVNAKRAPDN